MLDSVTKRRIDTARDILVGKVPDPKSQVEQITIGLIYKFMDDMDAESEELGGTRKFFAHDFARYGWAKLMRSGLGGHETLNLYAEAIAKMPENPGIPPLFRDIFKNAFLPYRDPETLRAFLKIIDEFEYDHSERLGDAFEYLLSVLGSQGDAGQFRTPRHIIDFIVSIVDPKKTETVLDPACGTAGFLISAYKHILTANTDDRGTSMLSPDEREVLARNFRGYDIAPDMVRLSLVNMYLHGLPDPAVHEYDTLTSNDRWNEYADVILANPPFMTPTGGIRPHNGFSVKSTRSEVLFVDYIREHLTPNGRAAIIVPEGIVFQTQGPYTTLRRRLVEESLVAVISLPVGVFHPYAGVKTSILFLDKRLSKRAESIAFFRIRNDGYDLGAQRRPIDDNDLPAVSSQLRQYLQSIGSPSRAFEPTQPTGWTVSRAQVLGDPHCHLGGERYLTHEHSPGVSGRSHYVRLGDILTPAKTERVGDRMVPILSITMRGGLVDQADKFKKRIASRDISAYKLVQRDQLVVGFPIDEGVLGFQTLYDAAAVSPAYGVWQIRSEASASVSVAFLELVLRSQEAVEHYTRRMQGAVSRRRSIPNAVFADIQIPLPSLEKQRSIVQMQQEVERLKREVDTANDSLRNVISTIW